MGELKGSDPPVVFVWGSELPASANVYQPVSLGKSSKFGDHIFSRALASPGRVPGTLRKPAAVRGVGTTGGATKHPGFSRGRQKHMKRYQVSDFCENIVDLCWFFMG